MLSENGSFLNKFLRNKSSVYFRNDLLQFFTLFYFLNESDFREATCGFCISKFWLFHCRYRSGGGMCQFVHFGSHWLHKNMCRQSLKDLIVIKIIYFLFHGIPWGYGHLIRLNHLLIVVKPTTAHAVMYARFTSNLRFYLEILDQIILNQIF